MERTITVRGTGKLSVKPDLINIDLTLSSKDMVYSKAMQGEDKQLSALREALAPAGFTEDDLKTASFDVRTEYQSVRGKDGMYREEFAGYVCEHQLKLEFPLDGDKLSEVLSAVSRCTAEPRLFISFSVKDKSAASDKLLASAAENAKSRARLLAEAAGAELGELFSITYDWRDLSFVSPTAYNRNMLKCAAEEDCGFGGISPQDIDHSDSAVFVWELA